MRLVMTLLVRNEADIIRQYIELHLYHGVDPIIVTDNCSTDDTLDILHEYEKEGFVKVIQEPALDFDQAGWVTRMANRVRDQLEADWILNSDADEFWYPDSGDIKATIIASGYGVCKIQLINRLYPWNAPEDLPWHQRLINKMNPPLHPVEMEDPYIDAIPYPHFCIHLPCKIACVTRELKAVTHGNHNVLFGGSVKEGICRGITIYHLPFRSKKRFLRNTRKMGSCLANSFVSREVPRVGWHKRRWYKYLLEEQEQRILKKLPHLIVL